MYSGFPTYVSTLDILFHSEFFYWGSAASVGESLQEDITFPKSGNKVLLDASAGSKYSIVVLPDGTAQSAGFITSIDNYHGHLGLRGGDVSEGENPFREISSVFDAENGIIVDAPAFKRAFAGAEQISSPGSIHSLLLDAEGQVWATGSNEKGQLCLGDFEDRLIPTKIPVDGKIINVAIGGEHTLLLHEDGTVYGCGSNEVGQIGLGSSVSTTNTPMKIDGVGIVRNLSAGLAFSLILSTDGLLVTGNNFYGQLCVDTDGSNLLNPVALDDVNGEIVTSFEAIQTSSYILFNDGSVGACGRNNFGQLGDGTNDDKTRAVSSIPKPIRKLGAGPSSESTFFIDDDGVAYGTGLNDRGQLGVGDTKNRNLLTVVAFSDDAFVQQMSAAGDHTVSR